MSKHLDRDTKNLIRDGIGIIAVERQCIFDSYKERDGVVRAPDALRELRKFDRWLERAKEAIK